MNTSSAASRWSVVAAFAVLGAATQIVWLTYAPVTTQHLGVSENAIGWPANLFPLFYVLLAIPAGVLLDRWFRGAVVAGAVLTAAGALLRLAGDSYAWALAGQCLAAVPVVAARRRAELPVMTIGLVLSAAACLLLALVPAVVTGFVSMTVVGFLLLPALPIVLELVGRRSGDAESTAAGLEWLSGNLGGLVVTLVVGLLVGQPGLAFATCAALCLVAVPGVWRLRPHLRELEGEPAASGGSTRLTER